MREGFKRGDRKEWVMVNLGEGDVNSKDERKT